MCKKCYTIFKNKVQNKIYLLFFDNFRLINLENSQYLLGLAQHDSKIIEAIYANFFPKVKSFVYNNKGNEEDAKDIFNKALMQLSARVAVKQFEVDSFEAYIFTACKNLWRKELNKKARLSVTSFDNSELKNKSEEMSSDIMEQERWELFHEKLQSIKEECRKILSLFFNKVKGEEIQAKLGLSSATLVRQRVFRCKKELMVSVKNDARFNELRYQ